MESFKIVGYAYQAAAYCCDHQPVGEKGNLEDGVEQVLPIFADDEWDHQPCCYECNDPIDVNVINEPIPAPQPKSIADVLAEQKREKIEVLKRVLDNNVCLENYRLSLKDLTPEEFNIVKEAIKYYISN